MIVAGSRDWQTSVHEQKTRKRSQQNPEQSLSSQASIEEWETDLQEAFSSDTVTDEASDSDYTLVDFAEEYEELDEEAVAAQAEKHREAIKASEEAQKREESDMFEDE